MQSLASKFFQRNPVYRLKQRLQESRRFRRKVRRFWKWTDYDERLAGFYKQFINPGDLVFDVGANMGNRAKVFWNLGATVVAFEPQAECFRFLSTVFRGKDRVILVNCAVGRHEGETEMLISEANTISSLCPRWIEAVQQSGRFSKFKWDKRQRVVVSTLEKAILEHGLPSFIKVDVEGFELEVLAGLPKPVPCLSIEFTPEDIESTLCCLDHMSKLSPIEARISLEETMRWETDSWLTAEQARQLLRNTDPSKFGDVYIRRLVNSSEAN